MAQRVHALALRYWADGRIDDARRVAMEAEGLLEGEDAPDLRAEISRTLAALTA